MDNGRLTWMLPTIGMRPTCEALGFCGDGIANLLIEVSDGDKERGQEEACEAANPSKFCCCGGNISNMFPHHGDTFSSYLILSFSYKKK